jgi:hypothetical protein
MGLQFFCHPPGGHGRRGPGELVVATAVLIVRAASGMFRAQALLSGQAFKLKIFLRALARKMKTSKWIGVGDCQRIVKKFPKL